jgi:hypothetical protein
MIHITSLKLCCTYIAYCYWEVHVLIPVFLHLSHYFPVGYIIQVFCILHAHSEQTSAELFRIYYLTKGKPHTEVYITRSRISKCFCSIRENWRNSKNDHSERNWWRDSKIVSHPVIAFYVPEFDFTESVTAVELHFRRKFHKKPPSANSVRFLGLSRHFCCHIDICAPSDYRWSYALCVAYYDEKSP